MLTNLLPTSWIRLALVILIATMQLANVLQARESSPPRHPTEPAVDFVDIAEKAGLTMTNVFGGHGNQEIHHRNYRHRRRDLDYDNDGWPDIFFVNGTTLEGFPRGQSAHQPPLSQQSRRNFHRCHSASGSRRDGMGPGRLRRRLRQRRLGRSVRHVLRQEPPVSQPDHGVFTEVARKSGRGGHR